MATGISAAQRRWNGSRSYPPVASITTRPAWWVRQNAASRSMLSLVRTNCCHAPSRPMRASRVSAPISPLPQMMCATVTFLVHAVRTDDCSVVRDETAAGPRLRAGCYLGRARAPSHRAPGPVATGAGCSSTAWLPKPRFEDHEAGAVAGEGGGHLLGRILLRRGPHRRGRHRLGRDHDHDQDRQPRRRRHHPPAQRASGRRGPVADRAALAQDVPLVHLHRLARRHDQRASAASTSRCGTSAARCSASRSTTCSAGKVRDDILLYTIPNSRKLRH